MTDKNSPDQLELEQPFVSHLIEMRDRLLRVVLVVGLLFLVLYPFANTLYTLLAEPLLAYMPQGSQMISTKPAGTFFAPMKLVLMLSIFAGMPFILYQAWAFVAPGLYTHEKRFALPLLASSIALFYSGMAFAYYVVFPLMFKFFISVAPAGVEVATDISEYLDFVLKIFFAFGVAFEVPIATILIVWAGFTTPEALSGKRPYVIVGAFVIGMLLTPPDIISQTLLALPMWVLFELGVIFSRHFVRRADDDEEEEEEEAPMETDEDMEETLDRYEAEEEELKRDRDQPRD